MSKKDSRIQKEDLIIKVKGIGAFKAFTNATSISIVSTLIGLQCPLNSLSQLWSVASSKRRTGWELVGASVSSFVLLFLQDVKEHLMKALSTATNGASG